MILAPPAPLREWSPVLPTGDLRAIVLHWTAGDYEQTFPAYHFCLTGAERPFVRHTHDLRANMRDVREPGPPYAAHTAGRNGWTIGLAAAAMHGATPGDFGPFPITGAQVEALCVVTARLAAFYGIGVDAIRTHAEAALDDGYFGAADDERWDIARLAPAPAALTTAEARAVGERFRTHIAALRAGLR